LGHLRVTPDELEAIIREIRTNAILGPPSVEPIPPPCDRNAEDEVSSALVGGSITIADVPGLHPKHFTHPFHAAILEVSAICPRESDGTLSLAFLENELRNRGYKGPLDVWLLRLRDELPFYGRDSVLRAATRVRELWRRRRLIERLRRMITALQVDTLCTDDAVAELKTLTTSGPLRTKAA
jgi:hypothetical protein